MAADDQADAPVALDDDERPLGAGRAREVDRLREAPDRLQPDRRRPTPTRRLEAPGSWVSAAGPCACAAQSASPPRCSRCSPRPRAGRRRARGQGAVRVPGAERQVADCLDDLTTKGTTTNSHTDRSDWQTLHASATRNPAKVVPGLQVDGYFPDTSTTNAYRGWMHDSQFVIRLPNDWNGKLVVTGAPGVRRQFATDFIIGDFVLAKGYAYAATDKGNSGTSFYEDGAQPGRRGRGVAPARDRAHARGQAGGALALRAAAGAHLHDRHLQRRLPDALAAREPSRALRRRRRLGGDADARRAAPTSSPTCRPRCASTPPTSAATRPRTGASSTSASPPAPSSSGTTTTRSTGTSRSAATARSSTPATTARSRAARRSAGPGRPAATPTTTTRRARRRSRTPSAACR